MPTFSRKPVVVLIGGAGYIGAVLTRKLLADGYAVRVFDNLLFGDEGVCDISSADFELFEGDILDSHQTWLGVRDADVVVVLASVVGRRALDLPHPNMREVNLIASTVALDAAREHGATRFIFTSTDSVYGLQSGVMYETGTPEPVSLYSRLKLRMEERVLEASSRHFCTTSLRIATCYGYSPRMRFDLFPNGMIRDAVCRKELVVENGDQCRPLVHVEDAATALQLVIKAHPNIVNGEVFNVGSRGDTFNLKQVANLVSKLVPDTKITFVDGEADLIDYNLSCSKIEKSLQFHPKGTLEESMVRIRDLIYEGRFPQPYSLRYHNTW